MLVITRKHGLISYKLNLANYKDIPEGEDRMTYLYHKANDYIQSIIAKEGKWTGDWNVYDGDIYVGQQSKGKLYKLVVFSVFEKKTK